MVCFNCGADVENGSNFCWHCGIKLHQLCDCWVKNELHNCGHALCPGYDLENDNTKFTGGEIMTKEYKDMIDRLAKAKNFQDGEYVLITKLAGEQQCKVEMETTANTLLNVIEILCERMFSRIRSEKSFNIAHDVILKAVSDAETRRFQRSEIAKGVQT